MWSFHMSDEQRRSAAQGPRPEGLRAKSRQTALLALAIEWLWPAAGALSGAIWRSNAAHEG